MDIWNTLFMWWTIWSATELKWSKRVCFKNWSNCNTGNQWPKGVCLCPHFRNISITEYGVLIGVTSNVLYRYAIWDLGTNFEYIFYSSVNLRNRYYLLRFISFLRCCRSNFIYIIDMGSTGDWRVLELLASRRRTNICRTFCTMVRWKPWIGCTSIPCQSKKRSWK